MGSTTSTVAVGVRAGVGVGRRTSGMMPPAATMAMATASSPTPTSPSPMGIHGTARLEGAGGATANSGGLLRTSRPSPAKAASEDWVLP